MSPRLQLPERSFLHGVRQAIRHAGREEPALPLERAPQRVAGARVEARGLADLLEDVRRTVHLRHRPEHVPAVHVDRARLFRIVEVSDATVSNVPSKRRPHSSPFALSVAEPELPPVVSTVERKFTGTLRASGPRKGSSFRPFIAAIASSSLFGALNSPSPSPSRQRRERRLRGVDSPSFAGTPRMRPNVTAACRPRPAPPRRRSSLLTEIKRIQSYPDSCRHATSPSIAGFLPRTELGRSY